MKTIKYFIFIVLTFFMGCTQRPNISTLSSLERKNLETFFRYLFEDTTAGYVLYGEKPLALCPFQALEETTPGTLEYEEALIFQEGLAAWQKLNIESKDYLLKVTTNNCGLPSKTLFLVNKQAFNAAVRENLSLFQFKLGISCNEENLLNQLLSPNGFSQLLKGHEALQGILFGYGVENALTYERGNALRKKAIDFSISEGNPEPTTPEELQAQILHYIDVHNGLGQDILNELSDFSFFIPSDQDKIIPKISFSFHSNSPKSKILLEHYISVEKILLDEQSKANFLEQLINRLIEQKIKNI